LALPNRVFSGQASSRITDYPNCAKPGTLAVILEEHNQFFGELPNIGNFMSNKF